MLARKIFILILLSTALTLSGCGKGPHQAAITGVIAHSHSMTIPAGWQITVQLLDITKSGAPGKQVAKEVLTSPGEELPMPFQVVYDPGKINPAHTYGLSVMIADGNGKVLYANQSSIPVITNGNPSQKIDVIVDLVNE